MNELLAGKGAEQGAGQGVEEGGRESQDAKVQQDLENAQAAGLLGIDAKYPSGFGGTQAMGASNNSAVSGGGAAGGVVE